MKTIYCIAFFCLSVLFSRAQAPGYMGKRFAVGYGFYFSPALIGSNGQGSSILGDGGNAETGTLAFNSLHEGFVEYTVGKKFTLGFSGRFYKSTYDNSREPYIPYGVATDPITGYAYEETGSRRPLGFYYIKGINYSLYGKLFFGKYIAPWGRYFTFGPTLKTYTCTYDPNEMKVVFTDPSTNGNVYYSNFGPKEQKFTRFDIMAGFGRSRIVGNRVTIDYGFNVQLIALVTTLFDATGETLFTSTQTPTGDYISSTAPARVRGVNRFNAFLKVGVLLF